MAMMHSTTLRLICAALLLVVPVSALGQEDVVTTPGIPIGESRLELYGLSGSTRSTTIRGPMPRRHRRSSGPRTRESASATSPT